MKHFVTGVLLLALGLTAGYFYGKHSADRWWAARAPYKINHPGVPSVIALVPALPAGCIPGITPTVQLSVAPFGTYYCAEKRKWVALSSRVELPTDGKFYDQGSNWWGESQGVQPVCDEKNPTWNPQMRSCKDE